MGTIRKRGKGYEADYYACGKRYREGGFSTKKEAQEYLGNRLQEIREGKFFENRRIKHVRIEELVDDYLARFQGKGVVTERMHMNTIRNHFSGKLVSQISVYDVETFFAHRKSVPTIKGTPRSAATCNRELGALKRLINKAITWGMAVSNPVLSVKPLREERGRMRFLSLEEAGRLMECASHHLRPIIATALCTGMRRGEIMGMRWKDIDLRNRTIFVPHTKNGHSRYVPISDSLFNVLSNLPQHNGSDYLFAGVPKIGKKGKPFNDVRTSFENACTLAGIENFRFHDLRHTAASHMAMAGIPLKIIGDVLGHRSIAMTERYAHLSPGFLRNAVNALPDWTGNGKLGRKMVAKSEIVKTALLVSSGKDGRDGRIRTGDPLLPKQMRYQAAPRPDARRNIPIVKEARAGVKWPAAISPAAPRSSSPRSAPGAPGPGG